jgi:hypothetical protein
VTATFHTCIVSDMDVSPGEKLIVEWDEDDVQAWLASLGYSQYESQIKGDLNLCFCSNQTLTLLHQSTTSQATFYACLI